MKLLDYAIQSLATKPVPTVVTITVERELAALLSELATEHDETPEQLFIRLVQKEHFERHADWLPMLGESTPKVCMSHKCFMRQGSIGITCSNCGASNPPTNYYCAECGAKL